MADFVSGLYHRWTARRPSTPHSFYTAESIPFSPQSPLPHIRSPKRNRKDDKTEEFLAMLIEAVDREAARKSIEDRYQANEQYLSECYEAIDRRTFFTKCLEAKVENAPTVAPSIQVLNNELKEHRDQIKQLMKEQQLLKRRAVQAGDQLSALLHEIYKRTDAFISSLDETGRLPAFRDQSGNLRDDVIASKVLVVKLRLATDCSRSLQATKEKVEEYRARFLQAAKACPSIPSPGKRSRRQEWRSRKQKIWSSAASAYEMHCKNQEQRENELLNDVARQFLLETGLIKAPRGGSEASSVNDVVAFAPPPGHGNGNSERVPGRQATLADDQIYKDWKEARQNMASLREQLCDFDTKLALAFAEHLYAYPNSTMEMLDEEDGQEMGMHPDAVKQTLETNLQAWKN